MRKLIISFLLLCMLFPATLVQGQFRERGRKKHKTEEANTMIDKKAATEVFIDATKANLLGDTDKATTLFKRCLEMDPGNDAAMYELAQIYFAREDYPTAARLVENAIEIDPKNQYYRLLSLDIYGKSGRKEDLLKTCQQLVKQYRNITTKNIFQDSIGFIYETPLFHKTRRESAAGKRPEGRNSEL